jgi:hypothetical protein
MATDLGTTNVLLGIIAGASVLEAAILLGVGVGAFVLYRRAMALAEDLEGRHVAPVMRRVHAVLDDIRAVTSTVREDTSRVHRTIHTAVDRVDATAERLQSGVRARAQRVASLYRGTRGAIAAVLTTPWRNRT